MIKYVCPKCGSNVIVQFLFSMPPQTRYTCTECDYIHTDRDDSPDTVVVAPLEQSDKE